MGIDRLAAGDDLFEGLGSVVSLQQLVGGRPVVVESAFGPQVLQFLMSAAGQLFDGGVVTSGGVDQGVVQVEQQGVGLLEVVDGLQ